MKNIEQKIRENTNEIFGNEPTSGHRERFAEKLSKTQKSKTIPFVSRLRYIVSAAAAIIVALFIFKPNSIDDENVAWKDNRIIEVQRYYAMLLEDEMEATKMILENIDDESRTEIYNDIKLMQTENNFISNALTDDEKAAIIVSVYSQKIESLQNIQSNLLAYNNE